MAASKLLRLAEVGIGAVRVGVPADSVEQAIALPDMPALLPRRHGGLLGVVEVEDRLVPVVDLARWVEVGVAAAPVRHAARVLILRHDGRTIGLKVDTVGGLVEVPPEAVTRLHHDEHPDEVFHSAARSPEDGHILSLLDAGRLAQLAAAWQQDALGPDAPTTDDADADAARAHAARGSAMRTYAMLQTGAARLAVPAGALSEVMPMPALERFGGGIDASYCRWRGRHLPVLPLSALGIGLAPDQSAPALLAVLERDGLALGLPVHAALQLHDFDGTGLTAPDGVTRATFDADGRPVQLLDDARLFERCPEAALSRDAADAAPGTDAQRAAGQAADRDAANATAYIVFEGEGLCATAIDAVERILSLPEAALDGDTMPWEGSAIPVRDLRANAHAGARAHGHVMVVRSADAHVGYAVARVHLLVPPGTGRLYRIGAAGRPLEFITTGDGAAQASYRIVDLASTPARAA